jgi:hypothetical protein
VTAGHCFCRGTTDFGPRKYKSKDLLGGANGTGLQKGSGSTNSSSSGSGGSSIKSSGSRGSGSSTSDSSGSSDGEVGTAEGELEGDADSLTSKAPSLVGSTLYFHIQNIKYYSRMLINSFYPVGFGLCWSALSVLSVKVLLLDL